MILKFTSLKIPLKFSEIMILNLIYALNNLQLIIYELQFLYPIFSVAESSCSKKNV